jgi:hypothetical protein
LNLESPLPQRSRWPAFAALYLVLTLAYAWPLLPVIGSALPNDTGDPGLNTWILWWNAHAVPLTQKWWNAPMFFPARGAIALSETFLNLAPLTTPLQWAGASAVLTYNLMFLLSFPTAALAAHLLARHLTGRHDAGLIAGLAFGFSPYRAAQMPHLQTLWACWMPLGLYALHRFTTDRRRRHLVLFVVCWLMNGLATGYFLFFFSVLVGLWIVWFVRSWRSLAEIGVALAIGTLPLVPLLLGYQHYQHAFGLERTLEEIEFFSADLSAVWATSSYVLPSYWTTQPHPEGELYPGLTIAVLSLIGAWVVWRRRRTDRQYRLQRWLFGVGGVLAIVNYLSWQRGGWVLHLAGLTVSLTRPAKAFFITLSVLAAATFWNPRIVDAWRRRSPFLFYTVAAVLMLLFALGPIGHLNGVRFLYEAPYYWLMKLPGGHAFRVPARFAMLFMLCLAQAAALAFARTTPGIISAPGEIPRGGNYSRSRLLTAVVATMVLLEGFVFKMQAAPVPPRVDLAGMDRGAVVLELPMTDDYSDTAAMLRATYTGHALVNGFSGYLPPHYAMLQEGLRQRDRSVVEALQRYGHLLVFVHMAGDADGRYREFFDRLPDSQLVTTTPDGALYRLASRPASARPLGDQALAITAVAANGEPLTDNAMTDGLLGTRWQTVRHQSPGDELVITFDRPVTISAVELDLGEFKEDYPRKLRISAIDANGAPQMVWQNGTSGLAMLAALDDRVRRALTIDLPRFSPTRQLVLTLVEGHPAFAWSVAELKVYGH